MTKKRALVAIVTAIAVIIGIAVAGSNAGATSYYEDDQHSCYISDCETTTTEYEETTTTTEVTTTTSTTGPGTNTTPSTIAVLPEPEIGTPLVIEREPTPELPPYVAPVPGPKPISFTG